MSKNFTFDSNNPNVIDPFHFSSITNETYKDTWLSTLHFSNNTLATFLGTILCISVIYLILYRTPYSIRPYSRMLLLCATSDAYLILADFWCRSRLQINSGILLVSFTGIGSLFDSYILQCFLSIPLQASAGMLSCAIVPAQFYYRFYLTKYKQAPSTLQTFMFFSISMFFSGLDGLVSGPSYYYSTKCRPNFDYGTLWFIESPLPQLIIGALCDKLMFYYLIYTTCLIIGSYTLTIFLGLMTMRRLRKDTASYTARTRRLQSQFNRILIVQSAIPLIMTTIPMSAVVLTTFMNISTGYAGTFLMMTISWIPFCNALTTILFITPYRQWLLSICLKPTRIVPNSNQQTTNLKRFTSSINNRSNETG